MTTQVQKQHGKKSISRYMTVIILAIMPVILALSTNGTDIQGLPQALSNGAYPIAFTLLSWGIVTKLVFDIRK
jgi:hypothetical protein